MAKPEFKIGEYLLINKKLFKVIGTYTNRDYITVESITNSRKVPGKTLTLPFRAEDLHETAIRIRPKDAEMAKLLYDEET